MEKNFRISEFVKVTLDDDTLDLHNDYDLSKISVNNADQECSILWESNQFCRTNISQLIITFSHVSRLSCNAIFDEEFLSLNFAGYLPNDDFGASDHFISEEDSTEKDHMVFSFENNSSISILAESAQATVRRTVGHKRRQ
jgi:hypothetical protein